MVPGADSFQLPAGDYGDRDLKPLKAEDKAISLKHWYALDSIARVVSCCAGVIIFLGLASLIQLWKPAPVVQTIKGVCGYLLIFGFGSIWILVGLRMILGRGGVKIDAQRKEVCVWHRTLRLNVRRRFFKLDQLKQIKIVERTKSGKFGPNFRVFSVLAGGGPDEVEFNCFSRASEAQALAKRIADYSGLDMVG